MWRLCDLVRVPVQSSTDAEPLYVVEVLLHCSKESVKDSATEAAKPCPPGEVGEMQVGGRERTQTHSSHTHITAGLCSVTVVAPGCPSDGAAPERPQLSPPLHPQGPEASGQQAAHAQVHTGIAMPTI